MNAQSRQTETQWADEVSTTTIVFVFSRLRGRARKTVVGDEQLNETNVAVDVSYRRLLQIYNEQPPGGQDSLSLLTILNLGEFGRSRVVGCFLMTLFQEKYLLFLQ